MAQRKTRRLSYGEYVSREPETSTQVWSARLVLIENIRSVFPKMWNELSDSVFPLYSQLARNGYNFEKILWNRLSPYQQLKDDGGLKSALSEWARRYHAEAGWLLDSALRSFPGWEISPDARARREWYSGQTFSERAADVLPFEFKFPGWRTEVTTWSAYSQSVHKEFEEKLSEYEKKSRQFAESRGLIRVQRQYSLMDLEWFILYQFAGMSSKKIADRSAGASKFVDESTVLKGIKTAAQLIGWEDLRETRQTRNRKTG